VLASFHGGSLIWLWVAAMLYGGWIVGAPVTAPESAGAPRTIDLALDAIAATIYNDLLGLACIVVLWRIMRDAPNKGGVWALAAFWGAHQVAKLNLFFGVAYPGADFLPSYLAHLARFFGATTNSPFLYLTIAGFGLLATSLIARTRREVREGPRMLLSLKATLVLLMLVEHTWLGVGSGAALWTLFLSARAG
jgi:putative photosynthetic complex assembly protein 2